MQIPQKENVQSRSHDFALLLLKGTIGRAIIETIFVAFGYEIYPHGYENHYANITRYVRKSDSDMTMTKIRAMPDLLVYDRQRNECYLLEIKTSSVPKESEYWIPKHDLDTYIKYWPEAILVVYCIQTTNIYCRRIEEIQLKSLPLRCFGETPGYYLKLGDFHSLPTYFRRIKSQQYRRLRSEIINTLKAFSE